jgi:tetratricopeptide (TPR) repeat protein
MKVDLINHTSGLAIASCLIAAGTPASAVIVPALTSAAALTGIWAFLRPKPYQKQIKALSNRLAKTYKPVAVMGPRGEAMDEMADAIRALKPEDCPTRDLLARFWGQWDKLADAALNSMAAREPAFAGPYANDARDLLQMAFVELVKDRTFYEALEPAIMAHQSRILDRVDDRTERIEEKIDLLVAEKQKEAEATGAPLSAEQLTTFEDGIRAVLMSTDARKAPAQEMLAERREIDAADYLMSAGLQGEAQLQDAMEDQASFFKEAGEIYQASVPAKALEAFRKAAQLDGSDFWAWIYLARLEQSHAGDLAAARVAAEASLAAALDEREKSVTYETIGDIAVAEGNLSDARDAYTKSMDIGQALSEADPNSAEAKRDVIVSLDRLGGVTGDKTYFVRALATAEEMAAAGQLSPKDAFIPDYLRAKIEGE